MNESLREGGAPVPGAGQGDLKAMILERLERSAAWLGDSGRDPAWVIHEVRKDLKRVRALLRLVEPAVRTRPLERDSAAAARELSGLRDADALLETVDRLAPRVTSTEAAEALAGVRSRLVRQRSRFGESGLPVEVVGPVAARLKDVAARLEDVSFEGVGADRLDEGLAKSRARAARAWRRVAKKSSATRIHEFRKAVKRELYQRELCGRPFNRMDRAMLKKLSEVLGELQDLTVLRQALETEGAWQGPVRELAREARAELKGRAGRLAGARYGEVSD